MSNFTRLSTWILAASIASGLTLSNARAVEAEFEADSTLPLVQLAVVSLTGSTTDGPNASGMSNFVGEMLLRGTRSKSREDFERAVDALGATLAVETRSEAVILRAAVVARKLPELLGLIREAITEPRFAPTEVAKLKSEITSAILEETSRDPSLSQRKFNEFLFGTHPYGIPVLGKMKDVARFNAEQVSAHYRKIYRSSRLVVVGLGASTQSAIAQWSTELAKGLPAEGADTVAAVPPPPVAGERSLWIIDKPERTQTQIDIGQIGVLLTDPRFFALHVANHAFGGHSFQARLMREIRVQRGWSYGAYSQFKHGTQPRSWHVHLFPASKDTAPALEHTLGMIQKVRDQGLTEEEFNFSKQSLLNGVGFMYNTPQKRMENRVLELMLRLPKGFMKTYEEKIRGVTLAQANTAMREFLAPERMTVSVLATAKELRPALAKAAAVADKQVRVVGFRE